VDTQAGSGQQVNVLAIYASDPSQALGKLLATWLYKNRSITHLVAAELLISGLGEISPLQHCATLSPQSTSPCPGTQHLSPSYLTY